VNDRAWCDMGRCARATVVSVRVSRGVRRAGGV
jgi:hypothetical protein